ncbi:MAG: proline--tRNA ligase [Pseudomonadota bacterium]|nr:proline--tRNA ligase [Pseudomonadota bacterium]
MRLSKLSLSTLKEVPAEAEVVSHQLMLRSGLIRPLASGLFTWMPLGLRILRKIERIVREEMNLIDAYEVAMPAIHPAELWQETGRWDQYGSLLLRMNDRHGREFCFGPTHEEVMTDIARRELKSYRQLPVTWYQIQTKFRDEIRPRFGVMRAREFVMKDAYSFHLDQASLEKTYKDMADAYARIFTRLGLTFRSVEADSGTIGGSASREFHVLAESGEDAIAYCDGNDCAVNLELAPAPQPATPRPQPSELMAVAETPGARSIDQVCEALELLPEQCLKTLLVEGESEELVALVLRGDHELNPLKAARLPGVATPLKLASAEHIEKVLGVPAGFAGPVELGITLHVDHTAGASADFTCGANKPGRHVTGVNWGRDLPEPETVDIRNVVSGDPSPGGGEPINIARGIEVGHIFQLGEKYSRAMGATVQDKKGKERPMLMGCYGIGVSRIVAAAIEQNHDDDGIIWPEPLSPFQVVLIALNAARSNEVEAAAETLYRDLGKVEIEVLYDDRDARPGVKFADADLLGIPHRLTVGERGLSKGVVEYQHRGTDKSREISLDRVLDFITDTLARKAS